MRKKANKKQQVLKELYRFYKLTAFVDGQEIEIDLDQFPSFFAFDMGGEDGFNYLGHDLDFSDCDFDTIDVDLFSIEKAIKEIRKRPDFNEWESITFETWRDADGYDRGNYFLGERIETDEEYESRLKREEEARLILERDKKIKKQESLKRREQELKKRLADLKETMREEEIEECDQND